MVLLFRKQKQYQGLRSKCAPMESLVRSLRESLDNSGHVLANALKTLNETREGWKKESEELSKELKILKEEKDKAVERVNDVETKVEQEFGVPIRQVTVLVDTEFTKVEMVTMMSGVHKLLNSGKNIDDLEFYVALIKKMQKLLDQMPESQETAKIKKE
jgi:hypothetical protein